MSGCPQLTSHLRGRRLPVLQPQGRLPRAAQQLRRAAPVIGGVGGRCGSATELEGGLEGSRRKPTSTVAAKPVLEPVMRDSSISKR
eukprot:scaffold11979_cov108-Isochrysis_galbana.AAC.2